MTAETQEPADGSTRQPRLRKLMIRLAAALVIPYLLVTCMLALLQRKLIYLPKREPIPVAETGFRDGRVRELTLATPDGIDLHGWLVSAGTAPDSAAPADDARRLVIYFQGNGGHRGYRVKELQQFTGLDCHVLYFDYRGYGETDGSPTEELLTQDAKLVWSYAVNELDVAPERILIWGESLGGGVAVGLASDLCATGSPPGGLMLRGTFSALTDAAAYHYPWLPVRWLLVDRFPSLERMPRVTCPLLMIHGQRDRIVPFEQGEQLFAAAPAESYNGVAKHFVTLPEAGHNDIMYVAADDVETALASFLGSLPQPSSSPPAAP